MNNKFSDIDKVIIITWLFFGAGVGVFVAPLFHVSFWVTGAIGLFAGVFVDYVLFFEPWRRKYGLFAYSKQAADDPVEEEEPDLSEFIRDSFEAEGIDPEADIEFIVSEGDVNEPDPYENNTATEETEELIKTDVSFEAEEEIEDSNNEDDESDGEFEEEDNSLEEDPELDESEEDDMDERGALPAFYAGNDQIHSSDYDHGNDMLQGLRNLIVPEQLPITMAVLWFFISLYLLDAHPQFTQMISNNFPASFFIILPIFFLIGISGLIGILFREPNETLERSSKENAAYLINLLKIFGGWGVATYAILVNL